MRTLIAILGAAVVLACSAAPALSMPAYDGPSETIARPAPVSQPVSAAPADGDSGIGALLVALIGGGALVAGAGLGFAAAHRRPLGSAA